MPTRSSKPHRDANQAAKHILDQLTGDAPMTDAPAVELNALAPSKTQGGGRKVKATEKPTESRRLPR